MKCAKCGAELRISQEQIGVNEQNVPILKTFAHCDKCKIRYDYDELLKNQPKKDSVLSIWAAILSLFTCTFLVGAILGIIDLCINDKTKRHLGSWFAIIFSVLMLIVGGSLIGCGVGFGGSETQDTIIEVNSDVIVSQNSEVEQTQQETTDPQDYYTEGMSFDSGNLRITINSVDLDYDDYEDEYGLYTLEEGMKYVCVSSTYENMGNTDAYVSIYDYVCYADGTLMEQYYLFGDDFINANLSPGRNVSFETYYIVPIDANEIELEYTNLLSFSDEKIIIKLQ